jgi:arginase family enzyme
LTVVPSERPSVPIDCCRRGSATCWPALVTRSPLLHELFAALSASGRVASASVCSHDPAFDEDGRAARAGIALVRTLLT